MILGEAAFIGIERGFTTFIADSGECIVHEHKIRRVDTDALNSQGMSAVTQVVGQKANRFYGGAVDVANRKLTAPLLLSFLQDHQTIESLPALQYIDAPSGNFVSQQHLRDGIGFEAYIV